MKKSFITIWFSFILLLCVTATPAQTANPPANANSGTITGRVLSDDGIPVARISVSVFTAGATVRMGQQRAVLTDLEGRFRFTGLSPASYSVRAFLPGFIAAAGTDAFGYVRIGDDVSLNLVKGGVIAGKVTNQLGEPVIALNVQAQLVKDAEGKPAATVGSRGSSVTNDLGEYRIYGLPAGTYVVGSFPNSSGSSFVLAYDLDVPVYYPSATRDTATEVSVQLGAESNNVDISYRSETGRRITGKITGAGNDSPANFISFVSLYTLASNQFVASSSSSGSADGESFDFNGVADGEYELTATRAGEVYSYSSAPRRVTVKGANVTGVTLTLEPQATMSGRVNLEPGSAEAGTKCANVRTGRLTETLVSLQRNQFSVRANAAQSAAVDEKGEFKIRSVPSGNFHLQLNLPTPAWYLKSVANESAAKTASALPGGMFAIRAGEALSGVRVTLAEGAARISGKVTTAQGKTASRARVHLIPAEEKDAANVRAYAETEAAADGTFSLNNLIPGKYRVLALPPPEKPQAPLAFDAAARTKLRKQAASAGKEITLAACQQEQKLQVIINNP